MTAPKFTRGPWRSTTPYCVWSGETYVAACCTGIDSAEQESNARLIASAPELYESLRAFIEWSEKPEDTSPEPYLSVLRQARAALGKAVGREDKG